MRIPAALTMWAAERHDQLSEATREEVAVIVAILESSSLARRDILGPRSDLAESFESLFPGERAERAALLVEIVATWVGQRAEADVARRLTAADSAPAGSSPPAVPGPNRRPKTPNQPTTASALPPALSAEYIGAPAIFGSDRVDEEDDKRLYGGDRNLMPWIAGFVILAGLVAGGALLWFNRSSDDVADNPVPAAVTSTQTDDLPPAESLEAPTAELPTPEPAVTAVPARSVYWADTTTILNSGTAEISASTYSVSGSNRAVLTGHTAAVTGVVVSNDGRVLTSGADNRLVDWGADVSLASPDVLNVAAPLTVLIRTTDQRLVAGDAQGNIAIINLVVAGTEPEVIPVHGSAISAIDEIDDGRLAVASVDGDVSVFAINEPGEITTLAHDAEVTAVVGLPDGQIATASVDGLVRLWSPANEVNPGVIDTHGVPVTSLIVLADGRLASGDIGGAIHIVAAVAEATPDLIIEAHTGSVRALLEFSAPDGQILLASGGDDSTIQLSTLDDGSNVGTLDGHGDLVSALNVLPDGRLVSTSADGTGRVWDLTIESSVATIPPHEWNISDIAPWKNDQFITGGVDGLVVLASTSETITPEVLTRHGGPVVGVAVMPNGDVVSLDALSTLHVTQIGEAGSAFEMTVGPGATALDARQSLGVVTGHADGTVRFHDLTEEVSVINAHGSGVNDIAALSSGLVVSAGQDRTVRIIDFDDPERTLVFDLHTAAVDAVAELPDGRVASSGTDGIYIWSVDDLGGEVIRLNGHRTPTASILGLPNNMLLTSAVDGRVRLWDLNNPEAEPITLLDIPGVVNPYLIQAPNGSFVAGAGRGYVVFTF